MSIAVAPENLLERRIPLSGSYPTPLADSGMTFLLARTLMTATKLGILDAWAEAPRRVAQACGTKPTATGRWPQAGDARKVDFIFIDNPVHCFDVHDVMRRCARALRPVGLRVDPSDSIGLSGGLLTSASGTFFPAEMAAWQQRAGLEARRPIHSRGEEAGHAGCREARRRKPKVSVSRHPNGPRSQARPSARRRRPTGLRMPLSPRGRHLTALAACSHAARPVDKPRRSTLLSS